jgi:tight adherence protein B
MNGKLAAPPLDAPIASAEDYLLYTIACLAAAGAFLLFVLVRLLWNWRTRRLQSRLEMVRSGPEQVVLRRRQSVGRLARLDDGFESLLQQTGLDLTPDQAIAWVILIGCVLAAGAYFASGELWLAALGLAVGAAGVLATFFVYRSIYRARLQNQLPDGIALLARALRSGLSLEQAVSLVGQESAAPLAHEFKKCDAQVKLGLPVNAALESMARQMRTIDFYALVSTIAVFQTSGGNLPTLLDRLANSARDRAQFRAYFRAATALARLSVIPVALTVPVLAIAYYIWTPSYAQSFMSTPNAPLVIGAAILVECLGLYWIYWLLRFDY